MDPICSSFPAGWLCHLPLLHLVRSVASSQQPIRKSDSKGKILLPFRQWAGCWEQRRAEIINTVVTILLKYPKDYFITPSHRRSALCRGSHTGTPPELRMHQRTRDTSCVQPSAMGRPNLWACSWKHSPISHWAAQSPQNLMAPWAVFPEAGQAMVFYHLIPCNCWLNFYSGFLTQREILHILSAAQAITHCSQCWECGAVSTW